LSIFLAKGQIVTIARLGVQFKGYEPEPLRHYTGALVVIAGVLLSARKVWPISCFDLFAKNAVSGGLRELEHSVGTTDICIVDTTQLIFDCVIGRKFAYLGRRLTG
jgi:hypothetical protein